MKKERGRTFKSASTSVINTDKGYNGKAFYFCQVTPLLYKGSNGEREKTKKPAQHHCHHERLEAVCESCSTALLTSSITSKQQSWF